MMAKNFDEFIEKVTKAEMKALNNPVGQEMTKKLLEMKLKENPNMTAEEWKETKKQFMMFIFSQIMMNDKNMMNELAEHTYNELKNR